MAPRTHTTTSSSFNPTLVRLRPSGLNAFGNFDFSLFQSHAGSIEAILPGLTLWSPIQFQSHAGSIEALYRNQRRRFDRGFNPTLVRLRHPISLYYESGFPEFQSHAGSIEASSVRSRMG